MGTRSATIVAALAHRSPGAVVLLALLAPAAGALRVVRASSQRTTVPATPRGMALGVIDDEITEFANPADTATVLARARHAGASVWGLAGEHRRDVAQRKREVELRG